MPNVHIRKDLYEKIKSQGANTSEKVNEILKNYLDAQGSDAHKIHLDDPHLREYHYHGNAD